MLGKISLKTQVKNLPYVGNTYVSKLEVIGIKTVEDLFYYLPFRYDNFTLVSKISQLQVGETVSITANVLSIKNIFSKNGKRLTEAVIADETGSLKIIWFNQHYITKIINPNSYFTFSGKVEFFGRDKCLISPQYEISGRNNIHTGRLVPIYSETAGLTSKWLRNRIYFLIQNYSQLLIDFLPVYLRNELNLIDLVTAISEIHFPSNLTKAEQARKRLAFDELFFIQLRSLLRKKKWQEETVGHKFEISKYEKHISDFMKTLPFILTADQRKATGEILTDLSKTYPMNRLLEGDVGSGKTIVAIIAIYIAYLNGYQSILMAPTEILANQHYKTVSDFLTPFGIDVSLYTSSEKNNNYDTHVFVGTHSLLNEKIKIGNVGLVIIDEQQRFGVEQRQALQNKGINPHLLTMTATPIPRTIALTMYGELDLSILEEMPQGRLKVKTWFVPEEKRTSAYNWMKKNGHQIFIVCPLIDESETLQSVKAAKKEFENLKKIFSGQKIGLLHGKLSSAEKQDILNKFKHKKIDVLVATSVVEVGIDIPDADIMVIEGADRFGLAQLHQLRGRVGRNNQQSYCLLFANENSDNNSIIRLKALETMYSGPGLAEFDLKQRGPGEVNGVKQHGIVNLKAARFSDQQTILEAKKAATQLIKSNQLTKYPNLQKIITMDDKKITSN